LSAALVSSLLASGILLGGLYALSPVLIQGRFERIASTSQDAFKRNATFTKELKTFAALKKRAPS